MRIPSAAFLAALLLATSGQAETDRCQQLSDRFADQFAMLAEKRLAVGHAQNSPYPPGSPEYCRLTRDMLSLTMKWVSAMERCGGEWRGSDKKIKGERLIKTMREQAQVACPRSDHRSFARQTL